jgi:CRISPR-associated endoribonuclease Cas6/Csy4 subtype I-F
MIPKHWIDIQIVKASEEIDGIPAAVLMAKVVWVCHGVFSSNKGIYAIGFPEMQEKSPLLGRRVRVFAEHLEQLQTFLKAASSHYSVRDYTRQSEARSIPSDFKGQYLEYRRYRISNKRSDRNGVGLREKRIKAAEQMQLPFLQLKSGSNHHRFSLFVQAIQHREGVLQNSEPDSYGLSVSSRPFCLPMEEGN